MQCLCSMISSIVSQHLPLTPPNPRLTATLPGGLQNCHHSFANDVQLPHQQKRNKHLATFLLLFALPSELTTPPYLRSHDPVRYGSSLLGHQALDDNPNPHFYQTTNSFLTFLQSLRPSIPLSFPTPTTLSHPLSLMTYLIFPPDLCLTLPVLLSNIFYHPLLTLLLLEHLS